MRAIDGEPQFRTVHRLCTSCPLPTPHWCARCRPLLKKARQAVEHYEITRYGSLIAWATRMGRKDIVTILEQTIAEEKVADKKLTAIAESKVNPKAA